MATNLRLRADAEKALRDRAADTGRSQQQLIREAVDQYLGLRLPTVPRTDAEALIADGQVLPPRSAFRELSDAELTRLPDGVRSEDLLDRDDRV